MKTRRKFIADTGKMTMMLAAFDTVFSSVVKSKMNSALAQGTGNFKQFLHINFYASPPRWMYDMFLNPMNSSTLMTPSIQVTNRYTGTATNYTSAEYDLVNYNASGTFVPYLWSQNVQLGNGASVKSWETLKNVISIRGVDIMNAAHVGANALHQQAVIGAPTISSLTADRAVPNPSNPVENALRATQLNLATVGVFRSRAGNAAFRYDVRAGVNNYTTLFSALRPISTNQGFNATFVNNLDHLEDKIDSAIDSLSPQAANYYKNLVNDNAGAMKILTDESVTTFQALSTEWDSLYGKYKTILDTVLSSTFAGINDRRIGVPQTAANKEHYSFRQGVYAENKVAGLVDMRTLMNGAQLDRLAAQFAVVEFLMTRKISPSISFLPDGMSGLNLNGGVGLHYFDQHSMGHMVGTLLNSMYYLAFNAALLELIRVLKVAGLFNDTLIYMAPEFGRCARSRGPTAGGGADHGQTAGNVTLISGRIPNLKIIGNIYKDSAGTNTPFSLPYKGCWGGGAPIDGSQLNILQVWGSVMALLGLPIPEIPNLVNKSRLIFRTPGSFAASAPFNAAPQNIDNTSRVG